MINVKYSIDKGGRQVRLTVKGHAGQADKGQDIVCAAASILAYTAAEVVAAHKAHGDLSDEPKIELRGGDARVECRAKDDYIFSDLLTMLFTVCVGYRLLAANYPQFVKFQDSEEGEPS